MVKEMTRNEMVEFLNRSRWASAYSLMLIDRLEELKEMKKMYDELGNPIHWELSDPYIHVDHLLYANLDMESELRERLSYSLRIGAEVDDLLKRMGEPRYRVILREKYRNYLSIDQIAKLYECSSGYTRLLHNRAIDELIETKLYIDTHDCMWDCEENEEYLEINMEHVLSRADKVNYLSEYRWIVENIKFLTAQLKIINGKYHRLQCSKDKAMFKRKFHVSESYLLSETEDTKKVLSKCLISAFIKKEEIIVVIRTVREPKLRFILEMKYLDLMSIGEIASRLGYSSNHISRLHNEGIDSLNWIEEQMAN